MKILQINCVYGEGSTGTITKMIHEFLLGVNNDSVVICGRRAPKNNENIWSPSIWLNPCQSQIIVQPTNVGGGVLDAPCSKNTERLKRSENDHHRQIVSAQLRTIAGRRGRRPLHCIDKLQFSTAITLPGDTRWCNEFLRSAERQFLCPTF